MLPLLWPLAMGNDFWPPILASPSAKKQQLLSAHPTGAEFLRRLGGSGVSRVRTHALWTPTRKSPLATAYREKPNVGPRIPSQAIKDEWGLVAKQVEPPLEHHRTLQGLPQASG